MLVENSVNIQKEVMNMDETETIDIFKIIDEILKDSEQIGSQFNSKGGINYGC
jgi:hypothetical protein